jgi:hypothetical protein
MLAGAAIGGSLGWTWGRGNNFGIGSGWVKFIKIFKNSFKKHLSLTFIFH